MRKVEMLKSLAAAGGITQKQAAAVLETIGVILRVELKTNGRLVVPGFGVFKTVARKERMMSLHGKKTVVPAHNSVKYKPEVAVKEAVN